MARRLARRARGFTLVELLVALFALAIMAVLSWRGLDGMVRTQSALQERGDEVLSLQVALAQWNADLEALAALPQVTPLEWNGRVVRLVRRNPAAPAEGVVVAAWSQRSVDGRPTWLRWQSAAVFTRGDLAQAWEQADLWARNPGAAERAREVALAPLDGWQVFFFRGGAWTNPQSSDADGVTPPQGPASGPGRAGNAGGNDATALPEGVRVVLDLPAGPAVSGRLSIDWAGPRAGGGRS